MGEKEIIPANDLFGNQRQKADNRPSITSTLIAVSEKLAAFSGLTWLAAVLLPVLIFLAYPLPRGDYDLWWQMALGKYYLTHQTPVVDHSIFSWTPSDPGWIYNTFLGSIIIYVMYSWMGGFGLWLFQWLIFLGIFLSFYVFLRLIGHRLDITAITLIAAVGLSCTASCSFYKPELFSPLILAWMGVIFLFAKLRHQKFIFYLYPVIFSVWVNLHGAFLLGFCFLACISLGEILNSFLFPKQACSVNEITHLIIACFLSFAAIFINPYGINYLLSIYHGVTSEALAMNTNYIQAYVSLWPHLKDIHEMDISFYKMGRIALIMAAMIFVLAGLFVYEFMKKRSVDFSFLLLVIATFIGSMWVVRTTYMFPLVFFFTFFYLLYRSGITRISERFTLLSLIIFILLFANVSYFTVRYGAGEKWFGAGLDDRVPVRETAFLKKYKLPGPIFNDYLIGGYLIWALYPDYKVFIDPRLVPYYKQVAPDYWELEKRVPTAEDIIRFNERYPFKTAIIHYKRLYLIFDFLKAGWKLVYFEKNAAILVHQSVLSRIPPEVQTVDLGPMRFKDVTDPEVLLNVFSIYVNVYPEASPAIYDIYRKNVSVWFKPRAEHLRAMEDDMKQARFMRFQKKL